MKSNTIEECSWSSEPVSKVTGSTESLKNIHSTTEKSSLDKEVSENRLPSIPSTSNPTESQNDEQSVSNRSTDDLFGESETKDCKHEIKQELNYPPPQSKGRV